MYSHQRFLCQFVRLPHVSVDAIRKHSNNMEIDEVGYYLFQLMKVSFLITSMIKLIFQVTDTKFK
jgi:hypothetical protein